MKTAHSTGITTRRTIGALVASAALVMSGAAIASAAPGSGNGGNSASAPGHTTQTNAPIASAGSGASDSAPGHAPETNTPEVTPGTTVDNEHPDNGKGNSSTKDQSPGASGFHKISICHHTGNAGWIVITMDETAWTKAHAKHQDEQDFIVTGAEQTCGQDGPTFSGCYQVAAGTGAYGVNKEYATLTGQKAAENAAGKCVNGTEPAAASGPYCDGTTPATSPTFTDISGGATAQAQLAAFLTGKNVPVDGSCSTGGQDYTPPSGSTTEPTGVAPLAGTAEESTVVKPAAATVKPQAATVKPSQATLPKAAQAGGGSSVGDQGVPPAALLLLGLGAAGALASGSTLVSARLR